MINWNLISENWNHLAPKAQLHWDKLSHEDLNEIEGNQETLTAKLQARYGFIRMDAERKVAEWGEELMPELEKTSRSARPERQSRPRGADAVRGADDAVRGADAVKSSDDAVRGADAVKSSDDAVRGADAVKSSDDDGKPAEEELPDQDPRFKVADAERPESPTSKVTPQLDRRNETRDRPPGPSSSDNVIP